MEAKAIRWGFGIGSFDPPPSPATLDDVARAMDNIVSGRNSRPEFTVEYVTRRRRDVVDGRDVYHQGSGTPYLILCHFLPDDESAPDGWLLFYEPDDGLEDPALGLFVLALEGGRDARFVEGNCCGGPLTVRSDFIVPPALVLSAAGPYLSRGGRSPTLNWQREIHLYPPPQGTPPDVTP